MFTEFTVIIPFIHNGHEVHVRRWRTVKWCEAHMWQKPHSKKVWIGLQTNFIYMWLVSGIRDTKKCLQTKYLANNIVFIFEQWLLKINLKEVHKNQPNHIWIKYTLLFLCKKKNLKLFVGYLSQICNCVKRHNFTLTKIKLWTSQCLCMFHWPIWDSVNLMFHLT